MKIPPQVPNSSSRSLRILCAEDVPLVGAALAELLENAGHTVRHVANGSEALDVFMESSDRIDLIITDNQMPGFTGLELVQFIRQTTYRGGLIVHCGALRADERASYVSLNVDQIVLKGATTAELLSAIEAVCNKIKSAG